MKTIKGSIGRSVDDPDPKVRFYLFHGADEAQSSALGDRLAAALKASKQSVASGVLRGDPALLADEAGAIDMFGGSKVIVIQPAGEEILPAVEALLEAAAAESPVVAIAGKLGKTSGLLKVAESHPLALAHVSYELDARDAERLVVELARTEGLRAQPDVAASIASACANDRRMISQELAKYALYLDASPNAPKDLGSEALDAVGADLGGDFMGIADLALGGDVRRLSDALSRMDASGKEAIPVVRSLQRRLLMLAPIRARVDSGERIQSVMTSLGKSLFWKDKPMVERMLALWDSAGLARVSERAGTLERRLMRGDSPPAAEALGEELVAIARQARRG
ncbi:DNA polymerase III subunit delta [Sphingomonas sediminicola]|uniref:DNA-directed DNA polymerase n=1 Tax=Sphingomonas sediminicola TaxID=386874 RepID=A0ABX6T6J7_9SPHN|nr:DNA polymerase III subunit delta [Sphingomonas sediminicola]QNP45487.1 DNA polymerase III subunit delta [Sphingomonas sediminicola]